MESLEPAVAELGGTRTAARHSARRAGRSPARVPIAEDFPGGPERHRVFPSVAALVIFVCTGVLAPLFIGYLHLHYSPEFSPIDEVAHYDYVTRIEAGGFPRLGQDMQPSTIAAVQCIRTHLVGATTPPCHTPVTAADQANYLQYEAQQPPTYYALAVPVRWVDIHLLGMHDLAATRMVGLLWLVAGLFVLWAACRVLGVPPGWIGAGLLLMSASPVVMDSATIVSNDAGGVLAGALVLLAAVLAWRRPWRFMPVTLFVLALVVTTVKTVDVLPVFSAAVLFGVLEMGRAVHDPDTRGRMTVHVRRWLTTGGSLAAGGLVGALGWLVASHDLAIVDPSTLPTWAVLRGHPNGFTDVVREAVTLLAPMSNSYGAIYPAGTAGVVNSARWFNVMTVLAELLTVLVLAAALSGLFGSPRRWFHWTGLVAVSILYVGGIALGYSVHYAYKVDASLSGRYGLAMVPLLVLVLVTAARGRWVQAGIWVFGVVSVGATVAAIVT